MRMKTILLRDVLMAWMFSSVVFLFVRIYYVCLFSFFPGQGNHVLYIGIIKFTTHRPRSPSLSHRTYSERDGGRESEGERAFIHSSMCFVIKPRQDIDGGLVIRNDIPNNRGGIQSSLCLPLFGRDRKAWKQRLHFSRLYLQTMHTYAVRVFARALSPYACVCVCVRALTGAGHGRRVGVGTEVSGMAVAGFGPLPERVALRGTFGASSI